MNIRKATEKDFPTLLQLIREFADFLGKGDHVKTTLQDFEKGKDLFMCLLAENNKNEVVGYALFFYTFHTWTGKAIHLDDLFVKEEYRKHSVGSMLIKELISLAKETDCKNIRWEVLNWNTNAIDFYKKLGATISDDNLICNLAI